LDGLILSVTLDDTKRFLSSVKKGESRS